MVESADCFLQLIVKNPAVGDDNNRIEQGLVTPKQRGKSIRCPSNTVRLPRSRRMLNQVAAARS